MNAIIDACCLEKIYPDGTRALLNTSLKIYEGEFVAVMGPSGSGKSTLLHIIGLLDQQSAGEYYFNSQNNIRMSDGDRANLRNKKIGFVFQAFNLLPKTSVFYNVVLPLLYSKTPESKWHNQAIDAIRLVNLEHRLHHESGQLSGGEKQRVAIARAIVNNPDVIFADEPTGNLDSQSGKTVMDIFEKLHDQGKTIILITHESETARHAERIITFRDGTITNDIPVASRRKTSDGYIK